MRNQLPSLSPFDAGDLVDVEAVFDDLRSYSTHVDGVGRKPGAAVEFATARPPGTRLEDKHAFVAHRNGRPVGLLDARVLYRDADIGVGADLRHAGQPAC